MTKLYEICGGFAYRCDNCEKEDGRESLDWIKKDFNLCLICLEKLFFEFLAPEFKVSEQVKIRRLYIPEKLRNSILKKFKNKCVQCNSTEKLEIDHIKPFSLGGKTERNNLQILCKKCNLKKRNYR